MGMTKAQTQCLKRVKTATMSVQKRKNDSTAPPILMAALPDWLVALVILIPSLALALNTEGELKQAMYAITLFSALISVYWISRVARLTELAGLLERGEDRKTSKTTSEGESA